ncbi:MAG: YHS domain-containing protein, partial [Xanthobacteraceae bacterium]
MSVASPAKNGHNRHHHDEPSAGVRDPVCGMTVDPHKTPHRAEHEGRSYYFCSAGCKAKFEASPETY